MVDLSLLIHKAYNYSSRLATEHRNHSWKRPIMLRTGNRRTRNSALAGLLAVMLFVFPSIVAAEPVAGTFQASGTTALDGPHNLAWDTVGASLRPQDGREGTAEVQLEQARVQWVNLPRIVTLVHGPGASEYSHSTNGDLEVVHDQVVTGRLVVALDAGNEEVRLLPQGNALRIPTTATLATIHPAGSTLLPPPNSTAEGRANVLGTDIRFPPPHTHALAHDASLEQTRMDLFVPAGTIWLPGEDAPREAGRNLNASRSLIDPTTGSGRYVYDNWVLLVTSGRTDVTSDGLDWHLAATRVQGTLDGTARWQGIVGAVAVNGTRTADDPETLEVQGDLRISSNLRSAPIRWNLGGEAVRVGLDNEPFWQSTATVAGLGALTALGLLAIALRGMATVVLGRSTPGLLKASLDSPSRRRILQAIHAHQPVRPADLPRLTGMTRSTLRYHLRVLDAHDVLQAHVPAGESRRVATLMLNSGSHAFHTTGTATLVEDVPGTVRADEALGTAHGHPLRRALCDALLEHGPGDFQTLRDRLRAAGVEADLQQRTASYHLIKLCKAGAIASKWMDGRKVNEANLDPTAVRAEQYRRYLHQQGALDLVQALTSQSMPRDDVLHHLQQRHHSRRTASRVLADLVAVAILEPTSSNRYRLSPPLRTVAPTLRNHT